MGNILELLCEIRLNMLMGQSLSKALENSLEIRTDPYSQQLKVGLRKIFAGQSLETVFLQHPVLQSTPARRSLIAILQKGLTGSSVDGSLQELEIEYFYMIESAFHKKMQLLPLKLMIPLALFILPAVVLLIAGPLLLSLTMQM